MKLTFRWSKLAAEVGCVSADHLVAATDNGIKMMAEENNS